VHVVPGGEQALAVLAAPGAQFDLLLTDIVMPGIDGLELVRRVRESDTGLPVLLTSGYPADFLAQQGGVPADFDLIQKPFSSHDLVRRVREALARG
jgi:CheY-like chemotaxis protein